MHHGRVISPLLFMILMNQFRKAVKQKRGSKENSTISIYADYMALVEFTNMINFGNNILNDHDLELNVGKTESISVGREHKEVNIKVEDVQFAQLTEAKYLGIAFDQKYASRQINEGLQKVH